MNNKQLITDLYVAGRDQPAAASQPNNLIEGHLLSE
jgi:hypothetical protein